MYEVPKNTAGSTRYASKLFFENRDRDLDRIEIVTFGKIAQKIEDRRFKAADLRPPIKKDRSPVVLRAISNTGLRTGIRYHVL